MNDSQRWLLLVVLAALAYFVYLLAPVLTPFAVSAVLAYIGDPLADRLEALGLSRSLSVVTVFLVLIGGLLMLLIGLVPMLERQVALLIGKLPAYLDWLQNSALPAVGSFLGVELADLDLAAIKQTVASYWTQAGGSVSGVMHVLSRSGMTLLGWLSNLLLIPVITFYLLRDWDVAVSRLYELVPRRYAGEVARLARGADDVLGAFFRGQLLVMLALGAVYAVGLTLVGLDLGLLVGMLAGLLSFVPYLGFVVGICASGIAAIMQFQDLSHLVWVAGVFGVGQVIEGFVLQPLLLGERIGLHPVAVIFAVMAGGQLAGFVGVLIALPTAAVIMVLLRYAHERYKGSVLYGTIEEESSA